MTLKGHKVAFLVAAEGIEQAELTEPWAAVRQAGGAPVLLSAKPGKVQAYNHLDKADTFPVDLPTGQAQPEDYSALVLPGGVANGDQLRLDPDAITFVQGLASSGRPVAVICHGGWILIEAGLVQGRHLTSWPSLQTDFRNAGADWTDEEVVVDNTGFPLISSRKPDDLPAFCRELVAAIAKS